MFARIVASLAIAGQLALVGAIPYADYILAPSSRTLYPPAIHKVNGTVTNAQNLVGSTNNGTAIFKGNSSVTFDFQKNVGGIISVTVGPSSGLSSGALGVTFTESSLWINGQASDATADAGLDSPLWLPVGEGPGTYTVAPEFDRGAFRYLSLSWSASEPVEIQTVEVAFTAMPEAEDLREYTGYFHSDDELLNRIWYAGAWTCQMCSIDPKQGNSLIWLGIINSTEVIELPETVPWWNNYTITGGTTVSVDGAKRDRLVWPGDLVVTAPSTFVSTGDMLSIRNGLDSLLTMQNSSGAMPWAGKPFGDIVPVYSFTYHLHGLFDIGLYYDYTNDLSYLQSVWKNFTLGLEFSISHIDDTGLMDVTSSADWLRVGMGGHNIEANAILYHTLNKGIELAKVLNDTASATAWAARAATIKSAANSLLWDASASLFTDNETTTLHPQDGNSWAIYSNLTLDAAQATAISGALAARWGPFGAPAPEVGSVPDTVSPFVGYFELLAHYAAGNSSAALELMRTQWGDFMLDDPRMTNSTFIEGYASDGSLSYAPYTNDARVSHAHGWATGPTSVLTFYTAGIRMLAAGGAKWTVAPRLGGLKKVEAGFAAPLGAFEITVEAGADGVVTAMSFETPAGSVGTVSVPGTQGSLKSETGEVVMLVNGEAEGVKGGKWVLEA